MIKVLSTRFITYETALKEWVEDSKTLFTENRYPKPKVQDYPKLWELILDKTNNITYSRITKVNSDDLQKPETVSNSVNKSKYKIGDMVQKKSGSSWRGTVCGFYATKQTPNGVAVESAFESGSVQIYPEAALEPWKGFWSDREHIQKD